jgi:ADP-ribose pyrophosphatase YjhB (NUDIX family)
MHSQKKSLLIIILLLVSCSSLNSVELKQPHSDLSLLLIEAEKTQNRLITFLNDIENKRIVINPGVKQMKTITQLLDTRWNGDASRITDYARATIGVNTIKDVYDCMNSFKNSSLQIIDIKDNFFFPTPENYRDINIVFKDTENGMLGEVQINAMPIIDYKHTKGHKLFDQIRNIRANAKIENRDLTSEELNLLQKLTAESKIGYDTAFNESLIINDKQIRVGVYAVIINDDKVLLTKTLAGSQSIMNFPGGGVTIDEGFADALQRECQEEIGCSVQIEELIYSSETLYCNPEFPDNYMYNLYFKTIPTTDIQYDIQESIWCSIDELPLSNMLPIDKEFIMFLKKDKN